MSEYIPGELADHGQGYDDYLEQRRADQELDRWENERFERLSEHDKEEEEVTDDNEGNDDVE